MGFDAQVVRVSARLGGVGWLCVAVGDVAAYGTREGAWTLRLLRCWAALGTVAPFRKAFVSVV